MPHEGVVWEELADRSRTALERLTTVRARVDVIAPESGFAGAALHRVLDVSWAVPDLWRVDDPDGLLVLRDGRRHVERDRDGVHQALQRQSGWRPDAELVLGWGHPEQFLDPPAFRTAVRGPDRVEVAGRPAWRVVLSAPGNKPYVLQVAVDDATGLVVDLAAEGTPYRSTVLKLALDEPLPPDTFSWNGPTSTARRDELRARAEVEAAPVRPSDGPLPTYWPGRPTWLTTLLDDGSVFARLRPGPDTAVLHRRALGTAPIPEDELQRRGNLPNGVPVDTWDDTTWSWTLLTDAPLDHGDLERVKRSIR